MKWDMTAVTFLIGGVAALAFGIAYGLARPSTETLVLMIVVAVLWFCGAFSTARAAARRSPSGQRKDKP